MEKMKMHSMSKVDENVKKIATLFPECVTEVLREKHTGLNLDYTTPPPPHNNYCDTKELAKVIDFDILKSLLSDNIVEGNQERYQFTWPDKRKARAIVNQEVTSTLRPCREESVNFDTTENLYIEGDNLEVLKLLQETYLGKIKMIYIDPPYNTGHDFLYKDDFSQKTDEYTSNSGQYDEQGNRLVPNTESEGKFHTNWLNMIYPRLRLAKDLLSEDGFIAISIGEEELTNLLKICNEIFLERNFRNIVAVRRYDKNLNTQFASNGLITMNVGLEYIVIYSKIISAKMNPVYREVSDERSFNGYWKGFWNNADRPTMRYEIMGVMPSEGQWKWQKSVADEAVKNYEEYQLNFSNISLEEYWEITGKTKKFIRKNTYGTGKNQGIEHWVSPSSGILRNSNWSDMLVSKSPGLDIPFDFPKNVEVISSVISLLCDSNDIILDFFSGSATTAHAVMKLNAEDGGHRKFIMIQIPEKCDEKSEAYKAGYKNICEIGKERIRRAGKQILDEMKNRKGDLFSDEVSLDIGFRDLKLDSSNMNDVYYTPEETDQRMLNGLESNIKADRSAEDLLFQVMLDLGVLLSAKIVEETISGKKIFNVDDNYLIACFDEDVDEAVIMEVANKKPTYFVMRDSSLANDSVSVNFDQIFMRYSPDTVRKVL